jgi:hypothetical protein
MGNWTITIEGTGAHHNDGNGVQIQHGDANRMAAELAANLACAGHKVTSAVIVCEGEEHDIIDGAKYLKERDGVFLAAKAKVDAEESARKAALLKKPRK